MLEPWTTEKKKTPSLNEAYSLMLSDRQNCPLSTLDTATESISKYIRLREFDKNLKELILQTGVPKSTFSKMKNKEYHLRIETLVALSLGLNIDYERAISIIHKAGYNLNESREHVLYKFLLERHGQITVDDANLILEANNCKPLTGKTRKTNKKFLNEKLPLLKSIRNQRIHKLNC